MSWLRPLRVIRGTKNDRRACQPAFLPSCFCCCSSALHSLTSELQSNTLSLQTTDRPRHPERLLFSNTNPPNGTSHRKSKSPGIVQLLAAEKEEEGLLSVGRRHVFGKREGIMLDAVAGKTKGEVENDNSYEVNNHYYYYNYYYQMRPVTRFSLRLLSEGLCTAARPLSPHSSVRREGGSTCFRRTLPRQPSFSSPGAELTDDQERKEHACAEKTITRKARHASLCHLWRGDDEAYKRDEGRIFWISTADGSSLFSSRWRSFLQTSQQRRGLLYFSNRGEYRKWRWPLSSVRLQRSMPFPRVSRVWEIGHRKLARKYPFYRHRRLSPPLVEPVWTPPVLCRFNCQLEMRYSVEDNARTFYQIKDVLQRKAMGVAVTGKSVSGRQVFAVRRLEDNKLLFQHKGAAIDVTTAATLILNDLFS